MAYSKERKEAALKRVDAAVLAQMGAALALQPDAPAREDHHELKELQVARTALVKDRTRLLNRIKTRTLDLTKRRSKALLRQIETSLKEIGAEIRARLHTTSCVRSPGLENQQPPQS